VKACDATFYDYPDLLEMWGWTEPYASLPSSTVADRLVPAVETRRCRLYADIHGPFAFATWALVTEEELRGLDFNNDEIWLRDSGRGYRLTVVDFICWHSVMPVARELLSYLHDLFPHKSHAHAFRYNGGRLARYPLKGLSHV